MDPIISELELDHTPKANMKPEKGPVGKGTISKTTTYWVSF